MKPIKERFDLLDLRGVDGALQHLFSKILSEDKFGRLLVSYYDENGCVLDHEILSVSSLKFSSGGVTDLSLTNHHLVRTLFISDSLTNLIFFLNGYHYHFNLELSAFILMGSALDKGLFLDKAIKYPAVRTYHCLFGNSVLGRIKDCKVQHWINGNDCGFRIEGDEVVSFFENRSFNMETRRFTLRDHLRQLSLRQTVNTKKPKNKAIENFYFAI